MKRYFSLCLVSIGSLFIMSWGVLGHKTIAQIAETHLNPQAKNAVKALLGDQSLSEVANWADNTRNQSEYRNTAAWHFLNISLGLNYQQFVQAVKNQNNENIYTALIKCEQQLSDLNSTQEQKVIALKFIVHFVGDLHQPMHISRAEDKGGNTIQVRYDNKGTNLHSLWDSKLIEHQGLSYNQLAFSYDVASPNEIKQWQSDDILKWIFESYQISNQLYTEAENNTNMDEQYYSLHLPIIQQRIEKAGIRLAGVLNNTLKSFNGAASIPSQPSYTNNTGSTISINEITNHIGEDVTICTKMFGFKTLANMTLVNMGADYPNQLLTLVLRGETKEDFKSFGSKNICVTGKILEYKGKPEIIITKHSQVQIDSK